MKQYQRLGRLLCAVALLFGASHAAMATTTQTTDTGSLTFSDLTYTYSNGSSYVAADLDEYSFVATESGSWILSLTTGTYDTTGTALAVLVTTDANASLLTSSTEMAALIAALTSSTDTTAISSVISTYVSGLVGGVYGSSYAVSGGTSSTSFASSLTSGTTYYVIVVGGTYATSSAYTTLDTSSVAYSVSVATVPEPQSWATMLLGLGLVGGLALRRKA
jgi:hypothetical protein